MLMIAPPVGASRAAGRCTAPRVCLLAQSDLIHTHGINTHSSDSGTRMYRASLDAALLFVCFILAGLLV